MNVRPDAKSSKPAQLAQRLRTMIIQDELSQGQPIRERELAQTLGVSRTPLREALKMLTIEGLIEARPRRSTVVASLSDERIRENLQLTGLLEAYAGELACDLVTEGNIQELTALHYDMLAAHARNDQIGYFQLNQSFHSFIVRIAGNVTLAEFHSILNVRVFRARYIGNLRTGRWESAFAEHLKIIEALKAKDKPAIFALLQNHVVQTWDIMTGSSTASD